MTLSLPPEGVIYFVSDVHLGYGTAQADSIREKQLVRWLRSIANDATHLFIVGDLFDFWFDYRRAIPRGHVRTLAALAELSESGIGITYLMGNHDFGHHNYFEQELGIPIDSGDIDLTIESSTGRHRMYISHGDGKAHNDGGYKVLRMVLRNRLAQYVYRLLHPNVGIGLAARTSHGSRDYTSQKDYGSVDGLRDFAAQKIAEGFDTVVMGHRHMATLQKIDTGTYANLGHWLGSTPTVGRYTAASGMDVFSPQI
jgi:UDP-2,3-diacylglucosamine hydrolase